MMGTLPQGQILGSFWPSGQRSLGAPQGLGDRSCVLQKLQLEANFIFATASMALFRVSLMSGSCLCPCF